MKRDIGLWIDRREAILVILSEGEEEIRHILSDSAKYSRYSGSALTRTPEGLRFRNIPTADPRDRKYGEQLNNYYDEVISAIRDADSIQIFGPGEAKGELEIWIKRGKLNAYMPAVEAVDRLSDQQVSEKVREHFLTERAPVKSG